VKDVCEILRQKEMDCARLQKEIAALRLVIPLLVEEEGIPNVALQQEHIAPERTGTDGPIFSSLGYKQSQVSNPPLHGQWY
jgi:hypothetical protein